MVGRRYRTSAGGSSGRDPASAADPVEISFDQGPLAIGADLQNFPTAPSPLLFWTGALDDVTLYTRALDDVEIAQLAAPP